MNVAPAVNTAPEDKVPRLKALRSSRLQDPLLSSQVTNPATVIFV